MKAISLWQPWASLIAIGAKRVETRGWPTSYRGEIAIHAAKRWTGDQHDAAYRLSLFVRENSACELPAPLDQLPRGAVVAVAQLVAVLPMDAKLIAEQTPLERELGGWEPGRFAWLLEDVRQLEEPVPAKGAQGIFQLDAGAAARCWGPATSGL